MRVISGQQRGKALVSPGHLPLRPTSNKVRAALFNILRPQIHDATFLDLFAGTGAVGINALSEGASEATFVEKNPTCFSALLQNIKQMGFSDKAVVKKMSVENFISKNEDLYYSIVFMDPPYAFSLHHFEAILDPLYHKTKPSCIIVVEHVKEVPLEELCVRIGFQTRLKEYSHTCLSILTKS